MVSITDVKEAYQRIEKHIHKTPILTSSLLNQWFGHEIYFKAECFQKIGAFKIRGAVNTLSWLIENDQKPKQVVANSSGNHAQAVALAAKLFGIPCTIYMPQYSSQVKIQATRGYGATVQLTATRDEADDLVKKASQQDGVYWIPPYNHEQVIAGQGTVVYEALQEIPDVNAVFAPCGGGGLLSGSLVSTKALNPRAVVVGVEPLAANDAAESLRKNKIQRLSGVPDTLADGAMTMSVGDITFEHLKKLDAFYEVNEQAIIYWTQWLTHLLKVRIEPTCAMSMEAVVTWLVKQKEPQKVLVIISGGNIDQQTTTKIWKNNCLDKEPSLSVDV